MWHLSKITIILLFFCSVYSQTKPNVRCEIDEPPVLRGFYIGQTVEEINSKIPNFQEAFNKQRNLENRPEFLNTRTEAGFILLGDTNVFYPKPGQRVVPSDEYEDIGFDLHFLDGKLFFMSVKYTEFEPANLKIFVQQVAEKTNLPTQGWIFKDRDNAILKCVGFNVEVWTGRYASRPEYADYPTVWITDSVAKAELDRREKAIGLRNKNTELERLRREKEKKTVFKP